MLTWLLLFMANRLVVLVLTLICSGFAGDPSELQALATFLLTSNPALRYTPRSSIATNSHYDRHVSVAPHKVSYRSLLVPVRHSEVTMQVGAPVKVASTLIIQNKGGGHGEIGYHLALQLTKERDMKVTILHEGPEKKNKPPHIAYDDLTQAGVEVIWFDDLTAPEAVASVADRSFDAIVDNWSKTPENIQPFADLAKKWGVKNYAYVSSAGMYTPPKGDFGAIFEDVAVKSSGQRQAEELLEKMGLPFSCFRPQYIYGPKQGKSYLKYFFDRLTQGRPVLVPNDGLQQVTMTHAADNAAMIAAAVGNEAAAGEIFNCATSTLITYDDLVRMCAKAAGVEAQIVHYDPKDFDIPKGFFPFRDTPFFVSADKAAERLGFAPKKLLEEDIGWYFDNNYQADDGVDFGLDDTILASYK